MMSGLRTIHIPASVEVLCKNSFSNRKSLASITFESNSKLQRIEEYAFAGSDLRTIHIPASVEVLCKNSFSNCNSLASITFELNSKLQRIEKSAFVGSGLKVLLLPNCVDYLSGSALIGLCLNAVGFWPGPCKFLVHEFFIEDIAGRSIVRYYGQSNAVVIESRIENLCESCFSNCRSLASITFESNSKLQRIEEYAFAESGLKTIHIPGSVEVLCKNSFSKCNSLASITIESNSKLHRIEEFAFAESGLTTIHVPASVEVLC
jgi:hypothetical protein